MIRVCNGQDEFSQAEDGSPCECGRRYNDVDRMVIFPHQPIGGSPFWPDSYAADAEGYGR